MFQRLLDTVEAAEPIPGIEGGGRREVGDIEGGGHALEGGIEHQQPKAVSIEGGREGRRVVKGLEGGAIGRPAAGGAAIVSGEEAGTVGPWVGEIWAVPQAQGMIPGHSIIGPSCPKMLVTTVVMERSAERGGPTVKFW